MVDLIIAKDRISEHYVKQILEDNAFGPMISWVILWQEENPHINREKNSTSSPKMGAMQVITLFPLILLAWVEPFLEQLPKGLLGIRLLSKYSLIAFDLHEKQSERWSRTKLMTTLKGASNSQVN